MGLSHPAPAIIAPNSYWTLSPESLGITFGVDMQAATTSSANDISVVLSPAADLAMYVPLVISTTVVAKRMFVYNGTNITGNIDIGLYNSSLARLVNSGSTVQAGAEIIQLVDITDTTLTPGRYYMAVQFSSGTADFMALLMNAGQLGTNVQNAILRHSGIAKQAVGSFGLPATAALSAMAVTDGVPLIGIEVGTIT